MGDLPGRGTEADWRRVEALFNQVVEQPASEQPALLAQLCGDDLALRDEVASLLARVAGAPESLRGAVSSAARRLAGDTAAALVGRRLGAYRLIAPIGEGGMGTVYLAERDDAQYRQRVAIKVLQRVLGSGHAVARFRDERQILAALDHPGIVRLLDGGTTEDGLPYLVMEHVEGTPITRYVTDHRLTVRERLVLFGRVCAAVQYAHQNLVVHRDIKPGNILVVAADGTPKLLDFGIAKLIDPVAQREARTGTGAALLTPEYASPEQAKGLTVSTAADVYSLGAVLYQLCAGVPPLVSSAGALDMLRLICEVDPPRPSSVAPRELRQALAGDIDNIVLKTLQKEPGRRYLTVGQLADDIDRHLGGLPVRARTATLGYRAGKFVRRNRGKLAAAAVAVISLALLSVLSLAQASRADEQARRAEHRFSEVRKLANTLIFELEARIRELKGSTAARELVVDRALEYLDSLATEDIDDPGLYRELALAYMKVGDIQGDPFQPNLGRVADGLASYAKARDIVDRLISAGHDEQATQRVLAMVQLGQGFLQENAGDVDAARSTLESALAASAALSKDSAVPRVLLLRGHLALHQLAIERGDAAAAERHAAAMVDVTDAWSSIEQGIEPRYWAAVALIARGIGSAEAADPDAARADLRESLRRLVELAGERPDDARFEWERIPIATNLAQVSGGSGGAGMWSANVGDPAAAEAVLREALPVAADLALRDPDDSRARPIVPLLRADLAAYVAERDPAGAIALFDQAMESFEALPEAWRAQFYHRQIEWFGRCAMTVPLAALGRSADVLEQARRGRELLRPRQAGEAPALDRLDLACRFQIARAHHTLGDDAAASALLDGVAEALQRRIEELPSIHNFVGLVATLDLLAQTRPSDSCSLRTRALTVWMSWPGRSTAFIQGRAAALERARRAACP